MASTSPAGNVAALALLGGVAVLVLSQARTCGTALSKLFDPGQSTCTTPGVKSTNQPVNTGTAPGGTQSSGNQVVASTPANGACGSTGNIYGNLNQAQNIYVQHGGPGTFDSRNFVAACSSGYVVIVNGAWL